MRPQPKARCRGIELGLGKGAIFRFPRIQSSAEQLISEPVSCRFAEPQRHADPPPRRSLAHSFTKLGRHRHREPIHLRHAYDGITYSSIHNRTVPAHWVQRTKHASTQRYPSSVGGVLPPSATVVSADLADAALASPALARARKLADWVGAGRELTSSGVLRPAVAAEACRALGIPLGTRRLRSALDVDELMRDWTVSSDAGFIVAHGRHVYASPELTAPPDPELVLNAWMRAAAAGLGVPDDPCAGCLTVLHELHTSGQPRSIEALAAAVTRLAEPETGQGEPCPDCGGIHDPADLLGLGDLLGGGDLTGDEDGDGTGGLDHAEGTIVALAAFGAAATPDGSTPGGTAPGDTFQLTPLGSMLAAAIFEGSAPAFNADADGVIAAISDVPPPVAWTLMRPWLEARSADAAVGELLAFAETASGGQRVAAIALASEVGTKAARIWRQWAKRPGFGAYARQWLASHGKPVAQDPSDEAWLAVDALAIMLDALSDALPPFLLAAAVYEQIGSDTDELLPLLRESGHPAAAGIMVRLGVQPGPTGRLSPVPPLQEPPSTRPGAVADRRARRKRGRPTSADRHGGSCQIKISLCGVAKPPVWRRVVIPADATLGELHVVIQQAMGWEDGHLHLFSTGGQQYGSPDPELGHADEASVRLLDLFSAPGGKLRYTYDFGDDWEHDIVLEQVSPDAPGSTSPSCLAGKGACPPEDCGGAWGYDRLKDVLADPRDEEHDDMLDWLGLDSADEFDPGAFSIDEVNTRLGHLTIAR